MKNALKLIVSFILLTLTAAAPLEAQAGIRQCVFALVRSLQPSSQEKLQTLVSGYPVVAIENLPSLRSIGTGASSTATQTMFNGKEAVLITPYYNPFGPPEGANIPAAVARAAATYRQLSSVDTGAMKTVPEIYAIALDLWGNLAGLVMEHIPYETLLSAVESGRIRSSRQLEQVRELVRAQLKPLHERGLGHHDIHSRNILVQVRADGSVDVRLIDFSPASPLSDASVSDLYELENAIDALSASLR